MNIDGFEQIDRFYFIKSPANFSHYIGNSLAKNITHKKNEMQGAGSEYVEIFKKLKTEDTQTGDEVLIT